MSVQDIVTIIQGVGFPIVMCGAMAYYVKYITDKNRDSSRFFIICDLVLFLADFHIRVT